MNELENNHKEGLKEIISKLPFVPTLSIERKKFFVGVFLIAIIAFVINTGFVILLGGMNFIFSIIFGFIFSYVMATWYTKRFLDIKPMTNAKIFQISFFILFLILNILTYIQANMMAELRAPLDYVAIYGLDAISEAPGVSATTEMYAVPVSIVRAIIGIPLMLFVLFLFFKKGRIQEIKTHKIKERRKENYVKVVDSSNKVNIKNLVISFLKKYKKKIIASSILIALMFSGVQFYMDYINYTYENIKKCESNMRLLKYSTKKNMYYYYDERYSKTTRQEESEDIFWARLEGAVANNDGKLNIEDWEIYPNGATWYTNKSEFCTKHEPFLKHYFGF